MCTNIITIYSFPLSFTDHIIILICPIDGVIFYLRIILYDRRRISKLESTLLYRLDKLILQRRPVFNSTNKSNKNVLSIIITVEEKDRNISTVLSLLGNII